LEELKKVGGAKEGCRGRGDTKKSSPKGKRKRTTGKTKKRGSGAKRRKRKSQKRRKRVSGKDEGGGCLRCRGRMDCSAMCGGFWTRGFWGGEIPNNDNIDGKGQKKKV